MHIKPITSVFFVLGFFCFVVSKAQSVGIGPTSFTPASTLSIKGSLSVGDGYETTAAPTDGAIIKGNVGIGTTSPSANFHIQKGDAGTEPAWSATVDLAIFENTAGTNATVQMFTSAAAQGGYAFADPGARNAGGMFYGHSTDDLYFLTSSSEKMRILSNGNVGIGTTIPGSLLHVYNASTSNTATTQIHIQQNLANVNTALRLTAQASGDAFRTSIVNNGSEQFTVASGGNVGIGTTGPTAKLMIQGGANNSGDSFSIWNRTRNDSENAIYVAAGVASGDFVVKTNGNVGIGTTSPLYLLDITSNTSTAMAIRAHGAAVNAGVRTFCARGTAAAPTATQAEDLIGFFGSHGYGATAFSAVTMASMKIRASENWTDAAQGTYLFFQTTPNGSIAPLERMRIQPDGNVGIGSGTPGVKLDVAGSVNCTGGTCSSDIRYKKDIMPLTNSLQQVLSLQGVTYYWKQDLFPQKGFNDRKQIGLIAQEVEKIFPELVVTMNDGYKSLDYEKLTPVLIEAIKEQQSIIENERQKNKTQEQQIQMLFEKLDALIKMTELQAQLLHNTTLTK